MAERAILYSQHALDRMAEMGVTKGEIESAINYPMSYYRSAKYGRPCYDGRRISVPVDTDTLGELHVITVLWKEPGVYKILGRKQLSSKRPVER